MIQTPLDVIAALLVLLGVVNVYFVWHGYRLYAAVNPHSALLFAMLGVKVTVWVIGLFIALLAARALLDLPVLPFNGMGVGIAILLLELLPLFIWTQMRRFVGEGQERDEARDEARDVDRDLVRDPGRDSGRDAVRDPARDLARDTEHAAKEGEG